MKAGTSISPNHKPSIVVGIDPDVDASGVAWLEVASRSVRLECLPFARLVDYLRGLAVGVDGARGVLIVVEASWLIRGNWHLSRGERAQRSASKGYDVGRNHETGRKIVEVARYMGLEVLERPPLSKCWAGRDRKITHRELSQIVGGLPARTNQEERDALLLAWVTAGLPLRLPPR